MRRDTLGKKVKDKTSWFPEGGGKLEPYDFPELVTDEIDDLLSEKEIEETLWPDFHKALSDAAGWYCMRIKIKNSEKPSEIRKSIKKSIEKTQQLAKEIEGFNHNARKLLKKVVPTGIRATQKNINEMLIWLYEARDLANEYPNQIPAYHRQLLSRDIAIAMEKYLKAIPSEKPDGLFVSLMETVLQDLDGTKVKNKSLHALAKQGLKLKKDTEI